ncbi:MAG: hypothetical protein ACREVM_05135 [Burkholderiales bacterium]
MRPVEGVELGAQMKTADIRRTSQWAIAGCALAVSCLMFLLGGCAWVGLTLGALTYPTTQPGESANVVANGNWAYVTRGAAGIEILHLGAATSSTLMRLPHDVESADDLAIADDLLFVLDARPQGHLSVFSLTTPSAPALVGTPIAVEVGPFSGVSAAAGRVIVSGGTSQLSLRSYDAAGRLGAAVVSADYGRGQPDVLLDSRGELALISTHNWGPYFRLTLARVSGSPLSLAEQGSLPLDTYGFTPGGAEPANFPIESAIAGQHAYVAFNKGLGVLDVSSPKAPKQVALLKLDVEPVNVDVQDGVAAMVGSQPKPMLILVDVRDAPNPKVLQSLPLPEGSFATGVALTPAYVIVAAHGKGSLLFDRSKGAWEHIDHTDVLPP